MVVLIIITYILLWTNIYIPFWGINWLSFLSASFFVIGYNFSKVKKVSHPLLCMIFSLLGVIVCSMFFDAEMLHYNLPCMFPCFLAATLGSIGIFLLSNNIQSLNYSSKLLIYIGEHTMPILVWHFLSFKFASLVIIALYGLPIEVLAEFPVIKEYSLKGWWILYSLVGFILPLFFNQIISTCKKKCF